MRRTYKNRRQIVQPKRGSLLRWLKELEQDALEMTGCGDPDCISEERELIALRAAILRRVIKDVRKLPQTLTVSVRVDP